MNNFQAWVNKQIDEIGGLSEFVKVMDSIPYRTALKWRLGQSQPPQWAQELIMESYSAIKYRKERIRYLQDVLNKLDVVTYPIALEIFTLAGMAMVYGIPVAYDESQWNLFHRACMKIGLDDSGVKYFIMEDSYNGKDKAKDEAKD